MCVLDIFKFVRRHSCLLTGIVVPWRVICPPPSGATVSSLQPKVPQTIRDGPHPSADSVRRVLPANHPSAGKTLTLFSCLSCCTQVDWALKPVPLPVFALLLSSSLADPSLSLSLVALLQSSFLLVARALSLPLSLLLSFSSPCCSYPVLCFFAATTSSLSLPAASLLLPCFGHTPSVCLSGRTT